MDFPLLLSFIVAYLIGSIPFGLIVTRLAGLGDIRTIGSGNIGATNVLRTGNKKLAALTLLLDAAKGAAVVLLVRAYSEYILPNGANISCVIRGRCGFSDQEIDLAIFALGAVTILGHMFPVWLKFKGGKGIATSFGVIMAYAPMVGIICLATWLIAAAISKRSSVAALTATALAPILFLMGLAYPAHSITSRMSCGTLDFECIFERTGQFEYASPRWDLPDLLICLILVALIWWKHRANIQRLLKGTEPKIGAGAKA